MTGFAGGWCDIISNIYLVSISSSLYRAPKSFVISLGDWYGRITFCSNSWPWTPVSNAELCNSLESSG